jgi:hypothetical protein
MIIKRTEKSAHWYLKNGEPFYIVQRADGEGPRTVRITDAYKVGAYRSVTNVLSVLDKPGLDVWKQEQCVLSALTLPRVENEDSQAFAERVLIDAEAQTRKAAEDGTRLHELCGTWLLSGNVPAPDHEREKLLPFIEWCEKNLHPTSGLIANEGVVLNHQYAYAGRLDVAVRLADGSIALIDMKTQEVKLSPKGVPKPDFYDEWALQLAAYSRCIFSDGSYPPPFPWRLISLVIDRARPGCYFKEWTDPANPLASSEPHFQAFIAACKVWTYLKGGTPGIDLKKAA